MMQAGEMWNLGVILYVLYQGEYPFTGFSDDDIINEIINKPNMWKPSWKEGINEKAKEFMLLLLDSNPFKKDKALILNDPYILQQMTPAEVICSNRALMQNLKAVYKIYSYEFFVEAVVTYLGVKNYNRKLFEKLNECLA